MNNRNYISDAEREWTKKYEGTYTAKEIELNQQLAEACSQEVIDFPLVESLLKQGADPLGATNLYGWDLLHHIYGDSIACDSWYSDSENLPQLTALFLNHGMNVDNPRIPYDGQDSLNPLWHFAHIVNGNTIVALKMLLDHGLSAESFAEFWDHAFTDYYIIDCGDPQNDAFWNDSCTWTLKMVLLGASYDHIIHADERLRELICCEHNNYDLHNFRNWDDYEYFFDTSHCQMSPHLYGSILRIFDKKTGSKVWEMGFGTAGRKALAQLQSSDFNP